MTYQLHVSEEEHLLQIGAGGDDDSRDVDYREKLRIIKEQCERVGVNSTKTIRREGGS